MEHATPPAPSPSQRLLLPISAKEESRSCIRYVLNRVAAGDRIEVFLTYILPPLGHGDMLRFRAEQQDADEVLKRANIFLEYAAIYFLAANIPCHRFVREADPVQGIQDLAEEWACSEVVLPYAYRLDLQRGNQSRRLKQLEEALAVTWVGGDGSPEFLLNDDRT